MLLPAFVDLLDTAFLQVLQVCQWMPLEITLLSVIAATKASKPCLVEEQDDTLVLHWQFFCHF